MYNGRHWRGYRQRHRAAFGFPWMIFFFIAVFSHSATGAIIALVIAVGLSILLSAIFSRSRSMGYQQPIQMPQYPPFGRYSQEQYGQSNQQQYPLYQRSQEAPYQAYEQGYRAPQASYRDDELQRQQNEGSGDSYQEYDQPRSLYPEQTPPMQQQ